jgi:hypothetical protein
MLTADQYRANKVKSPTMMSNIINQAKPGSVPTVKAATAPAPAPAPQQTATSAPSNALNELEYLKKLWASGTEGQKTWASNQANQYYNQLSPEEAAKVRGMNADQLTAYRNSQTAPVTAPPPTSGSDLETGIADGINYKPPTFQDSQGIYNQTIAQQAAANSPSNNLMDLFMQAIKTAGDPNSKYWDVFRELADQQAKGEVEGKQQQLDAARAGLDDKYFQEYLQSRQGMADRGLGNSGLANDANFRLQLAKQGQLADMFTKLGTFDQDSIAADKFKELYEQGNETMLQKAQSLQGMYGQAAQYDKVSTQDLLKQLFNYDQLAAQDKWNDVESMLGLRDQNINKDQFAEQSKQFYSKLDQDKQIALAQIGFDYDKLDAENRQFYDKLSQDDAFEAARLDMQFRQLGLDVTKVMGVDSNGNMTLDSKKLNEEIRHNMQAEIQSGNSLVAQMTQWAEQNRLDVSRLDLDEREFDYKQEYNQAMIDSAAANATSESQKQEFEVQKTRLNHISSQMNSYISKGKKVPEELGKQYNDIVNAIMDTANKSNFNQASEGGDYTNLWKTQQMGGMMSKKATAVSQPIKKALQEKGLPETWLPYLMELTARESSWNPTADNPTSTAYGLFQFLDKTWGGYGATKSDDPYKQALAGIDYVKGRYGTPQKALAFWDKNKWY